MQKSRILLKERVIQISFLDFLLELIYPNICGICGKLDSNSLCKECKEKLDRIIISKTENYKNDTSKFFDKHTYMFKYEGEVRRLILNYKFNNQSYLYKTFSNIVISEKNIIDFINSYEIIIPVPIHRKRFNNRGYNQSELFARNICKNLKCTKLKNTILVKIKNNVAQSSLNKLDRVKNVKNAYKVQNENLIKGKSILLVDDIYTTGNTVNECAKLLKENGAAEIGVFTLSKD